MLSLFHSYKKKHPTVDHDCNRVLFLNKSKTCPPLLFLERNLYYSTVQRKSGDLFIFGVICLTEIHVFRMSTEIRKILNFCSAFISLTEIHVFSMSTEIRKFMNFCSVFISLTEIHVFSMSTEIRKFMNFCSAFISLTEIHVFSMSTEIRKFMNFCSAFISLTEIHFSGCQRKFGNS